MKKRRKRKDLAAFAEEFAIALLFEASNGSIGRIKALPEGVEKPELTMSFHDRRALLDSMTKLVAMKRRTEPEDEEDGIASYREQLNGQHSSETSDGGDSPEAETGDSDSGDEA